MNPRRRLEAIVRRALVRSGLAGGGATLVAAISGGPDSTALLHCLARLSDRMGLSLHAAHLNHDFRGEEAEEDARFAAALARGLGIPSTVDEADPMAYQRETGISSFEEAAREVRYNFLASVARRTGAKAIALGHTADDQAETVLIHLLRGSGLPGLRGMGEMTEWRGPRATVQGLLFRPMLEATRRDTLAYCRELNIPYREDSTNLSPTFTRNRVRHGLLPALEEYNPRVKDALIRMGRSASEAASFLESEVDGAWPGIAARRDGGLRLDADALRRLHPCLQGLALRRAYRETSGHLRRLTEAHVRAMVRLLHGRAGGAVSLPGGLTMRNLGDELVLGPREAAHVPRPVLEGETPLSLPGVARIPGWTARAEMTPPSTEVRTGDPMTAVFDADRLGTGLVLRGRRPGDRFHPLGMAGEKKLKDFLIDRKVPREGRGAVPLLVSERGIMWVVGHRLSEAAKVRGDTRRAALIRFEPSEGG